MGTELLNSALAEMFPPNLTIYRKGWVWQGRPVQISYVLGYDEYGCPYMHDEATGLPLEMTPLDTEEDLLEQREKRYLSKVEAGGNT